MSAPPPVPAGAPAAAPLAPDPAEVAEYLRSCVLAALEVNDPYASYSHHSVHLKVAPALEGVVRDAVAGLDDVDVVSVQATEYYSPDAVGVEVSVWNLDGYGDVESEDERTETVFVPPAGSGRDGWDRYYALRWDLQADDARAALAQGWEASEDVTPLEAHPVGRTASEIRFLVDRARSERPVKAVTVQVSCRLRSTLAAELERLGVDRVDLGGRDEDVVTLKFSSPDGASRAEVLWFPKVTLPPDRLGVYRALRRDGVPPDVAERRALGA